VSTVCKCTPLVDVITRVRLHAMQWAIERSAAAAQLAGGGGGFTDLVPAWVVMTSTGRAVQLC
jgi:hypothetical protein